MELVGPKAGVACILSAIAAVAKLIAVRTRNSDRSLGTPEQAALFIRHARACYFKHASLEGRDHISSEHQLRTCLLDLTLRPSQVLVTDFMRRCASNSTGDDHASTADSRIGIGDFILFAQLIKAHRECAALKRQALAAERHRHEMNIGSAGSPAYGTRKRTEYQVFLGGSCNPTTWRKDLAVPALKQASITYYNPQMDDWAPHLVEIEQQAKQHAQLKYFVIDNKTRGVASMVEIAYLASSRSQIIVVMQDFERGGSIDGNPMSDSEVVDLNRGHDFLCHLLHQDGIPLFDDVETGLQYAIRLIHRGESIFDLGDIPYVCEPIIRGADVTMMDEATSVFRQYDEHQTGSLSLREAQLAVKSLLRVWISADEFMVLLSAPMLDDDARLTRDEFSCAVAGLMPRFTSAQESALQSALSPVLPAWANRWLFPHKEGELEYDVARDVFLGGGCGPLQHWREDIAIPMLRKHGVDYFNPNVANWTPQLIPLEAQAKKVCSVLLYFVGADTRSIGNMVEAAHFIGRGREVVLCLNEVPPSCRVDDDELGARAVKDLNRGRLYLQDIANRQNIKIFTNVREAVAEVIRIVGAQRDTAATVSASGGGSSRAGNRAGNRSGSPTKLQAGQRRKNTRGSA